MSFFGEGGPDDDFGKCLSIGKKRQKKQKPEPREYVYNLRECRAILRNIYNLPFGPLRQNYMRQLRITWEDVRRIEKRHSKRLRKWLAKCKYSPFEVIDI